MTPEDLQSEFWKSAATDAEQVESQGFQWPENEVVRPRPSVRDRLTNSWLSGVIPTVLLSLLGLLLAGGSSGLGTSLGALLLAPVFTVFVLPFVRRFGIISTLRITILSLPLLLSCAVGTLIPSAVEHRLQGNYLHPEYFAVVLQQRLESVLSPQNLGVYLAGTIVVVLLSIYLTNQSPWYEAVSTSKLSIAWRLCLAGLLLVPVMVEVANVLMVSEEHENWVRATREEFEKRPFNQLPENGDSEFWKGEFERYHTFMQKVSDGAGPEYEPTIEHLELIVSEIGLTALKDHVPNSKSEFEQADNYFFRHVGYGAFPLPSPAMSLMQIHFTERPTGGSIYTENILPKLLHALASLPADLSELESWYEQAKELRGMLFSREQELDMEAARMFWGSGFYHGDEIGWHKPEEVYSWRPENKLGWKYTGVTAPSDIRILGQSFPHSPTRLMSRYKLRELQRAWVAVRPSLRGLKNYEQQKILAALRDKLLAPDTTEQQFWKALHTENNVSNERTQLQAAETILSVRLFQKRNGSLPESLAELELAPELSSPERFLWTKSGPDAVLKDLDTEGEYHFSAGSS